MLCSCLFVSFRCLNRQPTNRAVEGSHLCSVRDKKKTECSVGAKKIQAAKQPNKDLPPIWCSSLFYQIRNIVLYLRENENRSKALADWQLRVSHQEWEFVSFMYYPYLCPFWAPMFFFVRSLSSVACWGRQKDKAPEQNRNTIWVLDALSLKDTV